MGNLPATVLSLPGGGALAAEPVTVAMAEPITWSGIALHGGALPGYPASHEQRLYGSRYGRPPEC